ncbi:MAG TPA: 50S ribosomal protein L5 [bacterium]|nr:50S ribosomal protein L5 [bacterium]HQL61978.1 50S ribosomal protein L5 [bacterium]
MAEKKKEPSYRPRLAVLYRERVVPEMIQEFGYKNVMQVPKVSKVIINMGVGEGSRDQKLLEALRDSLGVIAGQKPVITKSRKAIANFRLRQGMSVGCKVTLRRSRMYDFLDRLMSITIPRVRDFRGLSPRSFDGHGNYAMGLQEQLVFPEIEYDSIPQVQGMDIVIVTTAKTDEEAAALLTRLGMPFRR